MGNDAGRLAFGYTMQADAGIAAASGGNAGVEMSFVNFSDKTYGGYNYVYAGGHLGASMGDQGGASVGAGGSLFVAYNNSIKAIDPGSFEGKTISRGVSFDVKGGIGAGLNVNQFSGTGNWTDKGWHGVSVGVSIGVGGAVNAGSATGSVSQTYLMNAPKPTAQRSLFDRRLNSVSPVASTIMNPNPKYIHHSPQFD